MDFLTKIRNNIDTYDKSKSFYINGLFYTYSDLKKRIVIIQQRLLKGKSNSDNIGVISNNDLDTYSSILAILFTGKAFVPINPTHPEDRIKYILKSAQIDLVLSSKKAKLNAVDNQVFTEELPDSNNELEVVKRDKESNAYILYTSGTTGSPKGVIISYDNINSFLKAFFNQFPKLNHEDSFLQMFELTFDASIMHYLPGLCVGGCVYTIPEGVIKYLYAYKLLKEHNITFSLMMPSTLSYLKPYFEDINLPNLKYSLFGGEAVIHNLLIEWTKCAPNAEIYNAYGPTEASIFFLIYKWDKDTASNEEHNGLVPIGKELLDNIVIIVDEKNDIIINTNHIGEICVAGPQVSSLGYIENKSMNQSNFMFYTHNNNQMRFYKTGDLAFKNDYGNYMYCGRVDDQVQIDGYRIELNEIEYFSRQFSSTHNVVAIATKNNVGNYVINLFVEKPNLSEKKIRTELKNHLPIYMIPEKIISIDTIPLSINNKFDKKKLEALINKEKDEESSK